MLTSVVACKWQMTVSDRWNEGLEPRARVALFKDPPQHFSMPCSRTASFLAIAGSLGVFGCDQPKPKLTDEQVRTIGQQSPGMTDDCLRRVRFDGIAAFPDRVDQCFEMTSRGRWRGLWRDEFENQRFCPAPARTCSTESPGDFIWLTFPRSGSNTVEAPTGRLYNVEFIGRRTLKRGQHGHLGMSQHEMIVDKMISFSPVL